jgi:hypothetical protein
MPKPIGKCFRPGLFLGQGKERALKMKANSDMIVIMVFFSVALPLISPWPLLFAGGRHADFEAYDPIE